jgi:flavin reductase (DIM6/NTAB) family NADH-FMN oxidoreductase RutF
MRRKRGTVFHQGAMNEASYQFPPEVNELGRWLYSPAQSIRPPLAGGRVAHADGCKLLQIVPVGDGPLSANICILRNRLLSHRQEILLGDGTVNVDKIDLIARLGGDDYSTIRDRFALPNRDRNSVPSVRRRDRRIGRAPFSGSMRVM